MEKGRLGVQEGTWSWESDKERQKRKSNLSDPTKSS